MHNNISIIAVFIKLIFHLKLLHIQFKTDIELLAFFYDLFLNIF